MSAMTNHITAFALIGYDGDQYIRIVGGRALYETVAVRDGYWDGPVMLQRLDVKPDGLRVVCRWVDPLTAVELVDKTHDVC
jgi:hypothetical protein